MSFPLFWPLGKSTYTTASHGVTKAPAREKISIWYKTVT